MGGEWSKAVKMIFNKKYSNGRGKLVDAMKDPETKAIHSSMLGKKPMKQTKFMKAKNMNVNKTQKFKKKMRGGQMEHTGDIETPTGDIETRLSALEEKVETLMGTEAEDEAEDETEDEAMAESEAEAVPVDGTEAVPVAGAGAEPVPAAAAAAAAKNMPGGKRSKKNRSNKKKDKKGKSFRKKCGW